MSCLRLKVTVFCWAYKSFHSRLWVQTKRNCFHVTPKVEDYCVMLCITSVRKTLNIMLKDGNYCVIIGMISCNCVTLSHIFQSFVFPDSTDFERSPLWILSTWRFIIRILGEIVDIHTFLKITSFTGRIWKSTKINNDSIIWMWLGRSKSKMR